MPMAPLNFETDNLLAGFTGKESFPRIRIILKTLPQNWFFRFETDELKIFR